VNNQKSGTETGWHVKWALPMPENRALAGVIRRWRERRGTRRIKNNCLNFPRSGHNPTNA
jgi:hypothetical protein